MDTYDLTFEERRRLRYERRARRQAAEEAAFVWACLVVTLACMVATNLMLNQVDTAIASLLW